MLRELNYLPLIDYYYFFFFGLGKLSGSQIPQLEKQIANNPTDTCPKFVNNLKKNDKLKKKRILFTNRNVYLKLRKK